MSDLNSVAMVGKVMKNVTLSYTTDGCPFSRFFILCKNERFAVVVRRRLAEICAQFLKKGREVLVMGTLKQTSSGMATEIEATTVQFLSMTEPKRG